MQRRWHNDKYRGNLSGTMPFCQNAHSVNDNTTSKLRPTSLRLMMLSGHVVNRSPIPQEGRVNAGYSRLNAVSIVVFVFTIIFNQLFRCATICRSKRLVPSTEHKGRRFRCGVLFITVLRRTNRLGQRQTLTAVISCSSR